MHGSKFRHVPKTEPLIGTHQASKILSVNVRTVHRMIDDGRLVPAAKVPGQTGAYMFDPADVERLAETRRNSERAA